MAQKAKKPVKKQPKKFRLAREHIIVLIIGIAAVVIAGYSAVSQYQQRQEKQAFADAELVLAQLADNIEAKLGKPVTRETNKSCAYASAKYVKGAPRCSVSFQLKYPNHELEDMKQKQTSILTIIGASKSLSVTSNNFSTFENLWFSSKYKEADANFKINNSALLCSESISIENDNPNLEVSVGCNKDSKKEYFPVEN